MFVRRHPIAWVLAALAFILSAFVIYFFRDPAPVPPNDERAILSPASGSVLEVSRQADPFTGLQGNVIRIFLSVFDPHIQRAPFRGKVSEVRYQNGRFLDARDARAPFENEQNHIRLVGEGSRAATVTQIAGLIARRIVCWVKAGDTVEMAAHLGLIRFGSQVDIYLPDHAVIQVKAGDRVEVGRTLIARWNP